MYETQMSPGVSPQNLVCPISSIEDIRNNPAYMAVFLRYVYEYGNFGLVVSFSQSLWRKSLAAKLQASTEARGELHQLEQYGA